MVLSRGGQFLAFWNLTLELEVPLCSDRLIGEDKEEHSAQRAGSLAQEGAYRKEAQLPGSDGVLPPSDSVSSAFRIRHSQETSRSDNVMYSGPAVMLCPLSVDEGDLDRAVKRLSIGSAARVSKFRPIHISELLRVPSTRGDGGLLGALKKFANVLPSGIAPTGLSPWPCGALLKSLGKSRWRRVPHSSRQKPEATLQQLRYRQS